MEQKTSSALTTVISMVSATVSIVTDFHDLIGQGAIGGSGGEAISYIGGDITNDVANVSITSGTTNSSGSGVFSFTYTIK